VHASDARVIRRRWPARNPAEDHEDEDHGEEDEDEDDEEKSRKKK
jgi:hypothetical protein